MKPKGCSYAKRVIEVNAIYDEYAKSGLSNREIWRRYIHPIYGISENTFYNYINAAANLRLWSGKMICNCRFSADQSFLTCVLISAGTGHFTSFLTAESSYKRV